MVSSFVPVRGALGSFVDGVGAKRSTTGQVRRWDGAARTSYAWDGLRKDPELWFRNGNCLVHLYAKGQSRRGPSFRIPFRELVANKCFPLIERFLVPVGPAPRTPGELRNWANDPKRMFELYIPAPPNASKDQAYVYHVATRNFFAFIFRRSLVGEYLGHALVGLLYSLHEFRADVLDNVTDMMGYMDEEGYLDVVEQPDHALALMHLGEAFQLKDLYIRAFAHCVGMSDRVRDCAGYQHLSQATRRMLRQSRIDLDDRLHKATDMLNDFLDDELCESNLGIPAGARSHLERFRSFLLSFYTSRFGYYPPRAFKPDMLRSMRNDFEGLYKLLVDETYTASQMPWVASGGICVFQLVQIFDKGHEYEALEHPLPLLPNVEQKANRRMSWMPRSDRLKPDDKLLAHAAIIKASNWRAKGTRNDLVKAYRRFEEETVLSPNKADKQDKVSVLDARKVRWILIYAVHQVLRSVTTIPTEVWDAEQASYHLAIPADVIPWSDTAPNVQGLLRRQTDLAIDPDIKSPSIFYWADSVGDSKLDGQIEIKPDIDYFALTHREPPPEERCATALEASHSSTSLTRSASTVSRALSRNTTVRKSLRMFKPAAISPHQETASSKPVYHEILVQGYGNGLNSVNVGADDRGYPETTCARKNSTASNSSSGGDSPESTSSNDTLESSIPTPTTATSPYSVYSLNPPSPLRIKPQRREVVSMFLPTPSLTLKRPKSTNFITTSNNTTNNDNNDSNYSSDYEALVEEQRQSFFGSHSPERQRPVSKKRHTLQPKIVIEDDWAAMQMFMEKQDSPVERSHAWEQYADLGGFRRA